MKCANCQKGRLHKASVRASVEVEGHRFTAMVPALKCASCAEVFYAGPALERLNLNAAELLARAGARSAEAMRFMRKALGVQASEFAELLQKSPEHISRWENGKAPIDLRAMALLSSMVLDKAGGVSFTSDTLKALHEPKRLPKETKLELDFEKTSAR